MRNRLAAFLQVLALCTPYTRCNCNNQQFPGAFTYETPCCIPATSPREKHRVVAGKTKVVAACCSIDCTRFPALFSCVPVMRALVFAPCTNEKARLRIGNCSSPAHEFAPFFNLFCRQRRFAKRTRHESIRDKTSRLTPHVQVQQTL